MELTGEELNVLTVALDHMEDEHGFSKAILLGICGDAINAIFQAARDTRVVAIAPLELPLLYTPQSKGQQRVLKLRGSALGLLGSKRKAVVDFARPCLRSALRQWRKVKFAFKRLLRLSANENTMEALKRELGDLANVRMLTQLIHCLQREVPMLFVFGGARADGASPLTRLLPQLRQVSAPGVKKMEFHIVPEADHHFSIPAHTEQLFRLVLAWLEEPTQPWREDEVKTRAGQPVSEAAPQSSRSPCKPG